MATYYKYVDRNPDAQINWAEVGKGLSDTFTAEKKAREDKKTAINKATQEVMDGLSKPPQGLNESKRQAAIKFGRDASDFLLMQKRLLEAGQIDPKDYLVTVQNLKDGSSSIFNSYEDYQKVYADKLERNKTNVSLPWEVQSMAIAEDMANLNSYQPTINANGTVSMSRKVKKIVDGKEVETIDTNDSMPAEYINTLISRKWDRFDSLGSAKNQASALGKYVQEQLKNSSLTAMGKITTIDSIKNSPDYSKMKQNIAAAELTDWNRVSLLTVDMASNPNFKHYETTANPEEAKRDSSKILVVKQGDDWVPQFTDEQKKESDAYYGKLLDQYTNYEQSVKVIPQTQRNDKPQWMAEQDQSNDLARRVGETLGLGLTSGSNIDSANTIASLSSMTGLKFTKEGATIKISDPTGQNRIAPTEVKLGWGQTSNKDAYRGILNAISQALKLPSNVLYQSYRGSAGDKGFNLKSSYVPQPTQQAVGQGSLLQPGSLNPTGQ